MKKSSYFMLLVASLFLIAQKHWSTISLRNPTSKKQNSYLGSRLSTNNQRQGKYYV